MESAVMSSMRLDKLLANTGVGTRSEVKNMIRGGRVSVNGETVRKPEQKVDDQTDRILADGREICYTRYEYYMYHKPSGCVSATRDPRDRTVMDDLALPRKEDFFPVGRLDKDTEGLLLITNDGDLAHRLLSPAKHVDKTYFVRVRGRLLAEHVKLFEEGMDIGDEKPTLPAVLKIQKSGEESEAEVTIQEGRFHQVKRMFAAAGCEVTYLKRLSMGGVVLDENLEKGNYRPLTERELERLRTGKN